MARRSSHAGKTGSQKESYVRQLRMLDYDPTVKAELGFPDSDDSREDDSVPSTRRRRPTSFMDAVLRLKKHWGGFLIGIAIAVVAGLLLTFAMTYSRALGSLEGSVNEIRNTIHSFQQKLDKIDQKLDKIDDKVQEQQLEMREQNIRMNYLEKQVPPSSQSPQAPK